MSQNGPYPGPPHPWSGGDDDEPYTEPADPWGDQNTPVAEPGWGGHPTSLPPAPESSLGYPQPYVGGSRGGTAPPWGAPPMPPRRRNTPIVALVVVLGLLIIGGLGTTAWLLSRGNGTAHGSGVLPPATTPTTPANVANPQPSADARFVKKGQCVRNEGTADAPAMTIVPCYSGTYEVLKRVDGRTTGEADAEAKCSKVPNYTKWYFYDSELDSLDFVLCLKER
jgi:hypothetical protein